jgi:CRP-like cAMP-binding protein
VKPAEHWSFTHRLARRLERLSPLPPREKQALEAAASIVRRYDSRDSLAKQGDAVDRVFVIVEGFACRYKLLPDGRRQIFAYMLPGDMCDTRTLLLARMDHSIAALCPVEAVILFQDSVDRLERLPGLARAFSWNAETHHSISREWLVNVGHRTSFERIGHLFCEIFERLRVVGLTHDYTCELPLTQIELADTLALSSVHVNRTLMELRHSGLVTFHSKQLVIHNYAALCTAAGFDARYLHPETAAVPGTLVPGANA